MFIPIGDDNPTERKPFVNYAFIAANVLVFLWQLAATPDSQIRWMLVPGQLDWPTLFTSMFMHAGFLHIIFNMLFLWIFGDNVEDRLGHFWYILFYLGCGLAADAAHIAGNPKSLIHTLGASGAVSGVMGAYIVLYPRHHIKTFVWLYWFVNVIRTPAFLWIGIWIGQQILFNAIVPQEGGGVAYLAHIGGFVAGAAVAGVLRALSGAPSSPARKGADPLDVRSSRRRIFNPIAEDAGVEIIDDAGDSYSVLRLSEDPREVSRISDVVAPITNESPFDVVDRLVITRGVIARAIPREAAGRIQRELQAIGIQAAIIVHGKSNFPPKPLAVESASWDARAIRIRAGDQVVMVPWTAPFLVVAARVEGSAFIDLFLNRRTAYRVPDARGVALKEVIRDGRAEVDAKIGGFARAILDRGATASINDGVRTLAAGAAWDRLDFRSQTDYDDYVFWLYNLTLAQGSRS